ncbi:MAG: hypothetical protein JW818_03415 [Pirellulales bacterium]|nr:hypothetical protein [Pirellulales bacterium]
MADESWYRRKTWTPEDEAAFFARLKRSRGGFHKAQYCRIQAYELQDVGLYKVALMLLDHIMANWPEDAQQAAVFHQKAVCLERLGETADAILAYRLAFDAQRAMPSMLTNAHLDYAWLVATNPFPECFDEALTVLDEFQTHLSFPLEEFLAAAARAIILDAKGDSKASGRHAANALQAAEKTHSGFRYHDNLGLVKNMPPDLRERLEQLAARS